MSAWDGMIARLAELNGGGRAAGESTALEQLEGLELLEPEVVKLLEVRRQAVVALEALAAVLELVDEQLARR